MPLRKDKRYIRKLLKYSLSQHTGPSSSTTTRRHITASGISEKEVSRQPRLKPAKEVYVEPLLDAPQEEEADGVGKDGLEDPMNQVHDPETLSEEQTQTRRLIEEFIKVMPRLDESLMDLHANPYEREICKCGSGSLRHVRCQECSPCAISCGECFFRSHRSMRWHWADVWDSTKRIFCRFDYSALFPESEYAVLQLGHHDDGLSCSIHDEPQSLIVVHSNGIHKTKVRFCCCSLADRSTQLIHAGLFPGSPTYPQSAFTLTLLKQFQFHTRQSRASAFDWMVSLRRMTDTVSPHKVPDPYKAFLRVARVWDNLTTRARTGLSHGLNSHLPSRPANAILLYCPACPEPGVNMFNGWELTPRELQHIITLYLAMDGNHRSNRFTKNTDPKDLSLWESIAYGYFPSSQAYSDYLKSIPVTKEKSVCSFINAVNMQDRKKFRGNAETGIIAVLCGHCFVHGTVDMYLGERFAYSDYGLAHALGTRTLENLPITIAYDSACSYSVNVTTRFKEHLPHLYDVISQTRFAIDSLHVHDHIDKCMYTFSTEYMENSGHFHGVGVEQFWSIQNQSGPKTSQMNPGHRTDSITTDIEDWNWKKLVKLASALASALVKAWSMYTKKREWLYRLSLANEAKVRDWFAMDRRPVITKNGEVKSVFCNSSTKGLSFESAYQRLLKENMDTTGLPISQAIHFLAEGIAIKSKQISIRLLVKQNATHPLASTKNGIQKARESLTERLGKWRGTQALLMSPIRDRVLSQSPCSVEDEQLFLPSGFSDGERSQFGLSKLAYEESLLCEAQAYDCILQLRLTLKTISVLQYKRQWNVVGQRTSTRARSRIYSMEAIRDHYLLVYNVNRLALLNLGSLQHSDGRLPHLGLEDLSRKSTVAKRQTGDTYRSDGKLWALTPPVIWSKDSDPSLSLYTSTSLRPSNDSEGQPMNVDSRPQESEIPSNSGTDAPSIGRAWNATVGLRDVDLEEWEESEDQVQWHRSWAEMMRWLEEFELKHVEFVRCLNSFSTMAATWANLAENETRAGYAAFARYQSSIFHRLCDEAEILFEKNAEPGLFKSRDDLLGGIQSLRKRELGWLWEMVGFDPEAVAVAEKTSVVSEPPTGAAGR